MEMKVKKKCFPCPSKKYKKTFDDGIKYIMI